VFKYVQIKTGRQK